MMTSTISALGLMPFDVCHLVKVLSLKFHTTLVFIFLDFNKVVNSTVKKLISSVIHRKSTVEFHILVL